MSAAQNSHRSSRRPPAAGSGPRSGAASRGRCASGRHAGLRAGTATFQPPCSGSSGTRREAGCRPSSAARPASRTSYAVPHGAGEHVAGRGAARTRRRHGTPGSGRGRRPGCRRGWRPAGLAAHARPAAMRARRHVEVEVLPPAGAVPRPSLARARTAAICSSAGPPARPCPRPRRRRRRARRRRMASSMALLHRQRRRRAAVAAALEPQVHDAVRVDARGARHRRRASRGRGAPGRARRCTRVSHVVGVQVVQHQQVADELVVGEPSYQVASSRPCASSTSARARRRRGSSRSGAAPRPGSITAGGALCPSSSSRRRRCARWPHGPTAAPWALLLGSSWAAGQPRRARPPVSSRSPVRTESGSTLDARVEARGPARPARSTSKST